MVWETELEQTVVSHGDVIRESVDQVARVSLAPVAPWLSRTIWHNAATLNARDSHVQRL